MLKKSTKQGFALANVLILTALTFGMGSLILSSIQTQVTQAKRVSTYLNWNQLIQLMSLTYSNPSTCAHAFQNVRMTLLPSGEIATASATTHVNETSCLGLNKTGSVCRSPFLENGKSINGIIATSILLSPVNKGTGITGATAGSGGTGVTDTQNPTLKQYNVALEIIAKRSVDGVIQHMLSPTDSLSSKMPTLGVITNAPPPVYLSIEIDSTRTIQKCHSYLPEFTIPGGTVIGVDKALAPIAPASTFQCPGGWHMEGTCAAGSPSCYSPNGRVLLGSGRNFNLTPNVPPYNSLSYSGATYKPFEGGQPQLSVPQDASQTWGFGGEIDHTLTATEIPPHKHNFIYDGYYSIGPHYDPVLGLISNQGLVEEWIGPGCPGSGTKYGGADGGSADSFSGTPGSQIGSSSEYQRGLPTSSVVPGVTVPPGAVTASHSNLPPYYVVSWCVKDF